MPHEDTLERAYGIRVNKYAERARSFIIGDIPDYQIVKLHLSRTAQQEEINIKESDYPNYFGTRNEWIDIESMKAKGMSLENGNFFGVTLKRCEEEPKPMMIYITKEIPNVKCSIMYTNESAWRQYPSKDTFNEIIKEIKKEFRQNLSLQDEYLLLTEQITTKNYEKNNILTEILENRKNPTEALELCAYAAKVNLTKEDRHLWEKICIIHPPYQEAVALTDHKDIEKFRKGMMVMDETWGKLLEERIKYAHLNGTIDLDRLDVVMPQETRDELRKCLLQGRISMKVMKSLGDGETEGIFSFLEESYSIKEQEKLLKRTEHFR